MAETTSTLTYLAQRLHERSTWLMLPILLSLAGTHVSDDTVQMISTLGIALSGLLLALIPESNAQRTTTLLEYLSQRLQEPTTYTSIPVILGLIGIHANNEMLQTWGQVGIAVGGMLAALLAERNGVAGTTPSAISTATSTPDPARSSSTTPPTP